MTTVWHYRAANAQGHLEEGDVDAATEQEVVDALRRRALWAVDVRARDPRRAKGSEPLALASTEPAVAASPIERWRRERSIPRGALAITTRALATLLAAGVPLDRTLGFAVAQSPAGPLRTAFAAVRNDVRSGRSFADAVRAQPVFPPLYGAMAAAGDATGALDDTLARLADHLESTDELVARVRTALLYPVLLGIAAVVGVSVILLVVIPRFSVMLAQVGGTLPLSTRLLIGVSAIVTKGWFIWLPVLVLAVVAWTRWVAIPANQRRWHAARLFWPVTGALERAIAAARYTRTLALALPTGLGLLAAMRLARGTVDNVAIAEQLARAEQGVRDGSPLAQALGDALPPLAVQLLDAGEASGAMAQLAGRAATAFDGEVQRALSRAVSLVEPTLILGFGGIVGFVALALLQAIYGINARGL